MTHTGSAVVGPQAVMPLADSKTIAEQLCAAWNANLTNEGNGDENND